jgi:hypothetical protein
MLKKNLRKPRVLILSIIALLFLLAPMMGPTQKVKATTYVTYYTVRYSCIIGPGDHRGEIVGEWTVECGGEWIGWGWEPGESCTYSEVSYGLECLPE